MKPEQSERILVEELFKKTISKNLLNDDVIENIEKLTGDASTRKYYRIWTSTTSYVACLDNPITDPNDEPSFLKLQRVLHAENVRVPLIIDKDLATGRGLGGCDIFKRHRSNIYKRRRVRLL
jgi:aminoglycoside/choline kinase family phosphotransferase